MHDITGRQAKIRCMTNWYKNWPEHCNDQVEWKRLKEVYEDLRTTRDKDTHEVIVPVGQAIKGGASSERGTEHGTEYISGVSWPAVVFIPLDSKGDRKNYHREIHECTKTGLELAQRLIDDVRRGKFPPTKHD
ncbi:MAG: hypothetical protein IID34_07345 [Planctomycetes bacterium]|nr:hypothetical protein [Planctomycetota bacterium]